MEEKTCKKCQQKLATTCFYKKKSGLLGRDSICKTCISKQKKSRYQSQQNLNKKSFSQTTSRQNNPQIKLHTVFVDTYSKQARDALALLLSSIDKSLKLSNELSFITGIFLIFTNFLSRKFR